MNRVISFRFICLASTMFASVGQLSADPLNVLFIAVDDLRPELNCYGANHIHSPNIDRLAATGLRFNNAYCQQAVCNPSRTSLMTGLRPDTTGVTGNHSHFRTSLPNVVTLPQHFKNHGYHAAAIGKLYHGLFPDGCSKTTWDTMGDPESWSVPAIRFGPRYYYTEEGIASAKATFEKVYKPKKPTPDDWTKKLVFGLATESPDVPDETLYDGQVASSAITTLRKLKQNPDTPFFLAVGFIKPHSPYIAPKKYFDMYDDVSTATDVKFPTDAPRLAGHGSGELRRYTDQPGKGEISKAKQRRVRHAYYACVSYIDAQIGRVLDELDRLGMAENTIVSLYGDHGYHLGEQGLWGKTTNFELDTHVPLIIRHPKMKAAGNASSSMVELVDLYPTLSELAGLPVGNHLEGKSLAVLLDDPSKTVKPAAMSQYPRSGKLMGYSMRTPTHRLTKWVHQESGEVKHTELYEYSNSPVEKKNLASTSPGLLQTLSNQFAELSPQSFVGQRTNGSKTSRPDTATQQPVAAHTSRPDSFENVSAGAFKTLATKLGLWMATNGTPVVDNKHSTTGQQCLQLPGGEQTTVELLLADELETTGRLSFKAERWTKRSPFSFRIEKQSGGKWSEIYNGDRTILVGRPFLSDIEVQLNDRSITRLRFSVTSPANTGVLIDDLRIAPAMPQQVISVKSIPFALPALVNASQCPLLKLKIETSGRLSPIKLTEVRAALTSATNSADISSLQAFVGGINGTFQTITPFGDVSPSRQCGQQRQSRIERRENYIWLAAKLSHSANIDRKIGIACQSVSFSDGSTVDLKGPPSIQNMGVNVRNGGNDGVHTYRIPGLATTKSGTLIAVYDVRRRGGGDLPGDIDVGMSRSTDGGRTWLPMQIIMNMGDDPNFRHDGVGDPTVMVDKTTGTVWCAGTWSHGNRSWVGSQPGLDPIDTGQFILVKSDDDGVTWSAPINITRQVKKPEWSFLLQGPGKGITMSDGTLVMPAQYQDPPNTADKTANRLPHSTFIYSKDHGVSWQTATGAWDDTTEAQLVELADGQLMINCRNNRISRRAILTTKDLGKTWKQHSSHNQSLIEPGTCMASLINVGRELRQLGVKSPHSKGNDFLLFSNPDSLRGRNHITIKASVDGGKTWPTNHHLLLDEQNGRGYSCLTMIDAETVGIIYEGSQAHMTFQRIKLADILEPPINQKTKNPAVAKVDSENAVLSRATSKFGLARVFTNHMVLQANQPIRIWGRSKPGAKVDVSFGPGNATCTAGKAGRWSVELPAQTYNKIPQTLTVTSSGKTDSVTDVLIGEVWLCAGQSNMEWPLNKSDGGAKAVSGANDSQLRLLNFAGAARGSSGVYTDAMIQNLTPDRFCSGKWKVASPDSCSNFSAVGYYFGQRLRSELDCPIGIINVSIGGTPIESWLSTDVLRKHPTLQQMVRSNWLKNPVLDEWCKGRAKANLRMHLSKDGDQKDDGETQIPGDNQGPNHSFKPGFMYAAAIKPFVSMSIKGTLWYQGESNGDTPDRIRQYDTAFPVLVASWRKAFKNPDMPIGFVQLPAMGRPHWPVFREYQRRSLARLSNVGMAVTIDTGNRCNVHPAEKRVVANRLAHWAMVNSYGKIGAAIGPLFKMMEVDSATLKLSFNTGGEQLRTSDSAAPNHFQLAGQDGIFHPANAVISGNQILLTSHKVTIPKNARYAWADFPDPKPNLVNTSGTPASPFTTQSEIPDGLPVIKDDRPNILLIVSEDNGPELGCYGDPYATTPNLDAFAKQSVRFKTAYVSQAVCSSSRSTLLTGLYPHQNGQIGLATHNFRMFKEWPTSYSLLKQAGYTTGMLGKLHVNPTEMVEKFIDYRAIKSSNFAKKDLPSYTRHSSDFINSAKKPFFLTVNFPDAHWPVQNQVEGRPSTLIASEDVRPMPYVAFDNKRLRNHVQGFYNCMTRLDECVGELLDVLEKSGRARNTLVIYIGDHGAQFARGKIYVTEGGLRIPFIVRWPGKVRQGYSSKQMVSTIDILPTILAAAEVAVPDGLPGRNLAAALMGDEEPIRKYLFGERNTDAAILHYPQRAVRDTRYKLIKTMLPGTQDPATHRYMIHALSNFRGSPSYEELKTASKETQRIYSQWLQPPEYQLFDLQNDPSEFHNLANNESHTEIKTRLIRRLEKWQTETNDRLADPELLKKLTAEVSDCLKSNLRIPKNGWQYGNYLAP